MPSLALNSAGTILAPRFPGGAFTLLRQGGIYLPRWRCWGICTRCRLAPGSLSRFHSEFLPGNCLKRAGGSRRGARTLQRPGKGHGPCELVANSGPGNLMQDSVPLPPPGPDQPLAPSSPPAAFASALVTPVVAPKPLVGSSVALPAAARVEVVAEAKRRNAKKEKRQRNKDAARQFTKKVRTGGPRPAVPPAAAPPAAPPGAAPSRA